MVAVWNYKTYLLICSVFISGCGGGGGGGGGGVSGPSGTPSDLSAATNAEQVYLRRSGASGEWTGSGNWRRGVFNITANSIQEMSDIGDVSPPGGDSFVYLDDTLKISEINVKGVNGAGTLVFNNKDLTLRLSEPGSKLSVKNFIFSKGNFVLDGGEFSFEKATFSDGAVLKSSGNFVKFQASKDNQIFMKGGVLDFDVDLPPAFSLSGYGEVTKRFISRGPLSLSTTKTLTVGSLDKQGGLVDVTLTDGKQTALVSKSTVSLSGKLRISANQNAALGDYTLIQSANPITGDFNDVELVNVEGKHSLAGNVYKFTLEKIKTSSPYLSSNANTFFCGLDGFSHDFKTFLNTHQNVVNAASWQKDRKMFYALSWTNFGVYGELDDLNGFSGAVYGVSSAFGLKWTNFVHAGANVVASSGASFDAKHYFMNATSQISRSFGSKGLMISPKISAAFERIFGANGRLFEGGHVFDLSVEKENAFLVEGGVDVSSHFNIKSLPFQVFASAQIVNSTGHGLTLHGPKTLRESNEVKREFTFGVKATLSHASTAYVNTTFAQNVQTFGIGLDVRI